MYLCVCSSFLQGFLKYLQLTLVLFFLSLVLRVCLIPSPPTSLFLLLCGPELFFLLVSFMNHSHFQTWKTWSQLLFASSFNTKTCRFPPIARPLFFYAACFRCQFSLHECMKPKILIRTVRDAWPLRHVEWRSYQYKLSLVCLLKQSANCGFPAGKKTYRSIHGVAIHSCFLYK